MQWPALLEFSLVAFSSIFFLVDPFGAIPPFIALTGGATAQERRRLAKRASLTCFAVLTTFAIAGTLIFKLFGITLPALKIAGGAILFLIGIEMLQATPSKTKQTPSDTEEAMAKVDIGIIPLGIPMLAGPGAISSVMVLMGQSTVWWQAIPVFVAILITALISYLVLGMAERLRILLGATGIHILERFMGLLLTTLAIQFVINGLVDLNVIHPRP